MNQVIAPDPKVPPCFTNEFQNNSSAFSPFYAFTYSSMNLSKIGNKASPHHFEKSSVHLFSINSYAFALKVLQSYSVPSKVI